MICLGLISCGENRNITQKNNEKKLIQSNFGLYEKNPKYVANVFTSVFVNGFESILDDIGLAQKDSIKETLKKFTDPQFLDSDESKYNLILELTKKIPEPRYIGENTDYVKKYDLLLENLGNYYEKTAKTVPKILHFVWLGGPLGEIQKDYVKIWAKLNPDYKINIWYDSDHLLTYESNKKIQEYLNYSLTENKNDPKFQYIFSEKFISLQNDLFEKLTKIKEKKYVGNYDLERLNYIENTLYQREKVNSSLIQDKFQKFNAENNKLTEEFVNIEFKDLKKVKHNWDLLDIYDQELLLRGNFAAAGDSARIELLRQFGGVYTDIDGLPAINPLNQLVERESSREGREAFQKRFRILSLAFSEQIFNHFKHLSPTRKVDHKFKNAVIKSFEYDNTLTKNLRSELKTAFRSELVKIKNIENIGDIFTKLSDINIRKGEFKAAQDSNSFIASHPKTSQYDWIENVKNKVIRNYQKLNSYEYNNPKYYFKYDKNYVKVTERKKYQAPLKHSEIEVDYSIQGYRKDTLIPESRITIQTSGPAVFNQTYEELFPEFVSQRGYFSKNKLVELVTQFAVKNSKFTNSTEEDANSSWATRSKSRDHDTFGLRKIVLPLSKDENIQNAAELVHTKKIGEFKNTSLLQLENLDLKDKESNVFEKVNFYIVGHAEKENNTVKINNFSADDVAEKLLEFSEKNKNQVIDYIDIISCNPNNDNSDATHLITFTQQLMDKLEKLGISIDVVSVRKSTIKIDEKGNELSKSRLGLYEYANDADKIYVIKKGQNDFLVINTSNIVDLIQPDNLKKVNYFNGIIKNILSRKTNELGELNDVFRKIKDYYNGLHPSRRGSLASSKFQLTSSSNSLRVSLSEENTSASENRTVSNSSVNIDTTKSKKAFQTVAKYSFKGIDKVTSVTNKYNIFMNLLNTPKTLKNISNSFENNMVLEGVRESANFTINNADLVLDLIKYQKGNSYWLKHPAAFNNISRVQVGLNFASAGLDVWQAVDLFKAAGQAPDKEQRLDFIVNGSFTTARAASSIGTAVLLPLSAKAGPIGAAVGYTIMFAQGTYNAVRTSEELRKIGFKEDEITAKSILSFFGHYDKTVDPSYVTRIEKNKLLNEVLPNILAEKNKEFFAAVKTQKYNRNYFFKKMVYPHLDIYIPYTFEKIVTGCAYGGCVSDKTPGKVIEQGIHFCLSNNLHISDSESLAQMHYNAIKEQHHLLAKKFAGVPGHPESNYYSHASIRYSNNTVPCPEVANSKTMIEKIADLNSEQQKILETIPEDKKANLYLLGFGDQGKHGNMIHTVQGDSESINLYDIHASSHLLHILGGKKEDIFDFYDLLQSQLPNKGFIDGGDGTDTINLEGIKRDHLTISLVGKNTVSGFPEFKNIENVFGSSGNDTIIGNHLNNFLAGNFGDDEIDAGEGDDILLPGEGFDTLRGGQGSDQYIIFKKDLSDLQNQFKVIDNFDSSANKKVDVIKTDIKDLFTIKENNNLKIGYYNNSNYITIALIKNYFLDENYRHLVIQDMEGNSYYNNNGLLCKENESFSKLDSIHFENNSAIDLRTLSTDKTLLTSISNVIGNHLDDIIIGNHFDNYLIGNGGFDKISGFAGDDTISIQMTTNRAADQSEEHLEESFANFFGHYKKTEINGGEGNDNYVINFKKNTSYEDEFHVVIDNYDQNKANDNLIINDLNFEIQTINFSKVVSADEYLDNSLLIEFKDKEKKLYKIYLKKYFNSEKYRHLQIQIGSDFFLSLSDMENIFKSILAKSGKYSVNIYNELNEHILEDIKENNYYFVNTNILKSNLYSLNYATKSKQYRIKLAKFQNTLILNLINENDLDNYSILYLKDFFLNLDFLQDLVLEFNADIILHRNDLQEKLKKLVNGEIEELEVRL